VIELSPQQPSAVGVLASLKLAADVDQILAQPDICFISPGKGTRG
jgi:hypothetical protein